MYICVLCQKSEFSGKLKTNCQAFQPSTFPTDSWNNSPGSHLCTERNTTFEGPRLHLASFTAKVEECVTVTRVSSFFRTVFSLVSEVQEAHCVSSSTRNFQSSIFNLCGFPEVQDALLCSCFRKFLFALKGLTNHSS